RIVMGCGVALWVLLGSLGLAEVILRAIDFDFRGEEAALKKLPPFYREPREPSGTVYFRRHGPETWTGQPIRAWLQRMGSPAEAAYVDEPAITARYTALGFRPDSGPPNWEIAIAGDSFVELGCLDDADLFTTRLAEDSGRGVRNLGASNTGPMTHLHYLEAYGVSPALRCAIIVFYEGNDLQDLAWERRALEHHARTGKRGYRTVQRQSSLIGAAYEAWHRPPAAQSPEELPMPIHTVRTRNGPVPVTLEPVAPHPADLDPAVVAAWNEFLRRFLDFGRRHRVEIRLAYMPCKARALHGALEPASSEEHRIEPWVPTPLPEWVRESCRAHGVPIIDLTPALRRAVLVDGECPFNPLLETHLNAKGSAIVARELAGRLVP
ncbi:MAG: hypothetical protein AB7O66_07975, partial [Limisphaerales bacterium]